MLLFLKRISIILLDKRSNLLSNMIICYTMILYNVFVSNQFKFKIIRIDALLPEQFPAACSFMDTT